MKTDKELMIREARAEDLDQLREISIRTFRQTFEAFNSAENMRQYIDEKLSQAQLLKELKNQQSRFYLAFLDHVVAGYLKVNWSGAQTELKHHASLEIERIYMDNKFQGAGYGKTLLQKAVDIALQD